MIRKLKEYISNTGLKKIKVAEQLGITNVYLSYILTGDKTPSRDLENKINKLIS